MKQLMTHMLLATETELLSRLAGLPGAICASAAAKPDERFVYVPGSLPPERRALIVAHVDTVRRKPLHDRDVTWRGNICTAWNGPLGADDRAGCTGTWLLRNSGHSLLWTNGEESGCRGAHFACKEILSQLSEHAFALEIDRRGDQCLALYSGGTCKAWEAHLLGLLPCWQQDRGTFTDITAICDATGICGVNLAAGYINEHSAHETFFLDALQRSVAAATWLLQNVPAERIVPTASYVPSFKWQDLWTSRTPDDEEISAGLAWWYQGNGAKAKKTPIDEAPGGLEIVSQRNGVTVYQSNRQKRKASKPTIGLLAPLADDTPRVSRKWGDTIDDTEYLPPKDLSETGHD